MARTRSSWRTKRRRGRPGRRRARPEDEGVLEGGRHLLLLRGGGPWSAGDGALQHLDPGLVVDAHLEGVVLDAHDGAEDAGVEDDLVAAFRLLTISSSFFCFCFMGRMRTK